MFEGPYYETGLILNDGSFYAVRESTNAYGAKANALVLERKSGIRGIYWIKRNGDTPRPAFGSP